MQWLPWSWIVRRAARSFGVDDPALVLARVRQFGQPSKHDMPLEIVRNAIVFHSRGLINTRAIQHNLDWVWPYWIQRQFDPRDVSFLPRSANFSHINLTHRNWTAVGLPDLAVYPLVDPRGLVTPLYDGWSIDAWVVPARGEPLIPSRLIEAQQSLDPLDQSVATQSAADGLWLRSHTSMRFEGTEPVLRIRYEAFAATNAELVISLRPYNCEGVQFIDCVEEAHDRNAWVVNRRQRIHFDRSSDRRAYSTYADGDVIHRLAEAHDRGIECPVGMASAAACFAMPKERSLTVTVEVPLSSEVPRGKAASKRHRTWPEARAGLASVSVPDQRYRTIYEASVNTLLHLTAQDVYPGPYTYRRFWFRDASLMLESLVLLGASERAEAHLNSFPARQRRDGYFESQEGEWDSNGEVLWAFGRYLALTGKPMPPAWQHAIVKAARWLERHRLPDGDGPQAGLLPAGFSAEHFGPNDHYYWDVFWAIGGLRTASQAFDASRYEEQARFCRDLAQRYSNSVERSIERFALKRGNGAIPASPFRRMDAGAIGVLVADYPLQLYAPADPRIVRTLEYFLKHNFVNGGFFQDMTHSGVNVYLTLAIAHSLLRAGRPGWERIVQQVKTDASPTGVWPEAIHPITRGGCIGDGQHGWAAAEWLRWTRNAFVREERGTLILVSGLLRQWLDARSPLRFGPTLTPWGSVSVQLEPAQRSAWTLRVNANWRGAEPRLIAHLPGTRPIDITQPETEIALEDQAA